jgi:NADPH:quinone reductase-like Zn-dependent oxidoreductase
MVGGTVRMILRLLTLGTVVGKLSKRRMQLLLVHEGPKHFGPVADRIVAGDVKICIDRVLPLEQVPEALTAHGEGRALGKVVIAVR